MQPLEGRDACQSGTSKNAKLREQKMQSLADNLAKAPAVIALDASLLKFN
jgi:hypothetical protein